MDELTRAAYDTMDDVTFVKRVSADIVTLGYDTHVFDRYAKIAKRGALAGKQDVKEDGRETERRSLLRSIPIVPLALGLWGLIPFWALAVALDVFAVIGGDTAGIDLALATYAAVIISFLGGVRWGLAAQARPRSDLNIFLSVIPSLVAWTVLFTPEPWRLASLSAVAFVMGPIDARLVAERLAPRWLGSLRLILSASAGAALFVGALGLIRV